MTENQWRTVFIVVSAVVSFLLVQPDVQQYPIVLLTLGVINVALAALNPNRSTDTPE